MPRVNEERAEERAHRLGGGTPHAAWPPTPLQRTAAAYTASWQGADATPSLIVGHARSIATALDDDGPSASAEDTYQKLIGLMMALEREEALFTRYCADDDEGVARSFDAIARLLARSWVSVVDRHGRLCCSGPDGERQFVLYAVRFLDGFWPSGSGDVLDRIARLDACAPPPRKKKKKQATTPHTPPPPHEHFAKGDLVLARYCAHDPVFYPGVVAEVGANGKCSIIWDEDDTITKNVPRQRVLRRPRSEP